MTTKPISAPVAAEVRQDVESESALIQAAKQALSTCNWKLGECASLWTARWAKGRTDEDFGNAVGLSRDQVCQRRLVWDRFGEKCYTGHTLTWSHFREALTWDDADSCLQWACDNQATVAEMKAWRNVQHSDGDEDPFGEREGTGNEAGGEDGGKETGGTDSKEQPPRPPRNGTDKPGGSSESPPKDPFLTQKAKTVKTFEAAMRAIGDLHELHPVPQKDAIVKSVCRAIETVKSCK